MTTLLIALLGVLLVPLFVSTWRIAVLGLALQGVLMSIIAYRADSDLTLDNLVTLVDFGIVRTLFAPWALLGAVRGAGHASSREVNAPNILSWTLAFGVVLLGFRLANRLVPEGGDEQALVAVTVSAILLGFLRLATQAGPALQMVALLQIENAIALFEHGGEHEQPLALHIALATILLITILFFRWYLSTLDRRDATSEPPAL